MTDDNIETHEPPEELSELIDRIGEVSDLELELKSTQDALAAADIDHTAEVVKSDAAITYLYSMVEAVIGPFAIADLVTAETVALAMLRHRKLTKAGFATAEELETAAQARAK